MKTIYIVRHAKSSWDEVDLPDDQRPLTEKGKKRTLKVINYFLENRIKVDYIISSHAVRAHETAKILANGLKYPAGQIKIDPAIYHASGDNLIDLFYELPDNISSVMIVGHNPTLTDFANLFLKPPIEDLPTSGVVSLTFETGHWKEIPRSVKRTNFILFPKDLQY